MLFIHNQTLILFCLKGNKSSKIDSKLHATSDCEAGSYLSPKQPGLKIRASNPAGPNVPCCCPGCRFHPHDNIPINTGYSTLQPQKTHKHHHRCGHQHSHHHNNHQNSYLAQHHMYRMEQERKRELRDTIEVFSANIKHHLLKKEQEERVNVIKNEWKLIALIVDRVLFWVFSFLTVVSSVVLLVVIPILKNRNVIKAYQFDEETA
jgi:hypothetical protein